MHAIDKFLLITTLGTTRVADLSLPPPVLGNPSHWLTNILFFYHNYYDGFEYDD